MDWIYFLHGFTIINKCLLFPLFFFKKNNSAANRLLALLILLPAVPVAADFFIYSGYLKDFPYILFLYQVIINFFGPVYYFYCMTMIGRPFKMNRNKLVHLLPSIIPLFLWADYASLSPAERSAYIAFFLEPGYLNWRMTAVSITPIVVVLPYMSAAAWKVYKYISSAKDVFTNLESLKINFIKEFILITIGEVLLLFSLYAFVPVYYIEAIWVPVLGNIMYFYIIYKSYNYSVLFSEKDYESYQEQYKPLERYIQDRSEKYSGSGLSGEKMDQYALQLAEGFAGGRWYLDAELNLSSLASKSGIPAHNISQVINQKFGKNFFDYVNEKRVDELKRKLLQPDLGHYKIEELAFMSGFNSKAAYQRAFKKHAGTTPSEWRDKHDKVLLKAV